MTRCPVCQHSFEPAQVPGGMCPACLLAGGDGVDGDDFLEEEVPRMVDWTPPGLDGMQALLPGYDWLAFIGRGGMGAVYKARQTALDRLVAIKVLPAAGGGNSGFFTDRFRNEARLLARMSHPGIVHVYDFGTLPDGSSFIVMEFVDGTDVARMVSATGRLPPEHAASITADVCAALHYAHGAGIVHRDIKPANILVNLQGQVKVADFGLAKARHGVLDGITQTRFMMGTPEFLAPESLTAGMVVDHRADLYAVGVMLYNMLTGQIPRGVFPPASRSSQSPPAFDGIISKAMQADPERRYQTAAAIKKDLDIARSAPASKEGKIRRGPLLFVGLACLLTGTGVWHFGGFGPSRASDKTRTDPVSAMQTSSTNPTLRKASSGMVATEESRVDFEKYFQKLKESNPDCELLEKGSLDSEGALRITDGEGMLFLRLNGLAQLKNLNCLRPMGITHLDLRGTGVVDFRPILTSSLRLLYFTNGPGIDTDLLSLSQLEEVMVEGDYPFNLEHLVSPVLKYLDLNKVPLDSLEPLARCPSLRDLYLASAPVRDLRPLQGLPLQTLSLENTLVDNLEALRGMKNLQELRIHGSLIPDFSPLLDLPKLRVLRVDGSAHEGAGLREFLLKWAAQGKVKGQ